MTIRTRVLLFNILIISATVAVLGTSFSVFVERVLYSLAIREIHLNSEQATNITQQFFSSRIAEQNTLSRSTFFFRKLNFEQIESRFQDYRSFYRSYQSISFYDANMIRKIDLNRTDLGQKTTRPDLFEQAKASSDPVYTFDISNPSRPRIIFVTRVQAREGPLIGYISAVVPLVFLQQSLNQLGEFPLTSARTDVQIYSNSDTLIFSRMMSQGSPLPNGFSEDIAALRQKKEAQHKKHPSKKTRDDKTENLDSNIFETALTYSAIFSGPELKPHEPSWFLVYHVLKADILHPAMMLRYLAVSLLIALLCITWLLNYWLSGTLLSPIEKMTALIKEFNLSDSLNDPKEDERLTARPDEIGLLSRGFYEMRRRLKNNFAEISAVRKFAGLGELAAGIAHEINNPLTVILGKATLLEQAMAKQQEKIEIKGDTVTVQDFTRAGFMQADQDIKKIIEMVGRISKTISAIRAISRTGEMDPVGAESVFDIIKATLELTHERLRLAQITLFTEVQPEDSVILARPVQISQILLNLINNAHDAILATQSSDMEQLDTKNRWIKILVNESSTHVKISVLNSGPKISGIALEKVFEPFFTTKPAGIGTGIGLTISQRLAEVNGGTLSLDTTGENTCFVLEFPRPDHTLLHESTSISAF